MKEWCSVHYPKYHPHIGFICTVVNIKGARTSESIVDEFKAIKQPNIGMQEFHKGAGRELVGTFKHDFPSPRNANPHYRSEEALVLLA